MVSILRAVDMQWNYQVVVFAGKVGAATIMGTS